jgi:hypothetical protein
MSAGVELTRVYLEFARTVADLSERFGNSSRSPAVVAGGSEQPAVPPSAVDLASVNRCWRRTVRARKLCRRMQSA